MLTLWRGISWMLTRLLLVPIPFGEYCGVIRGAEAGMIRYHKSALSLLSQRIGGMDK